MHKKWTFEFLSGHSLEICEQWTIKGTAAFGPPSRIISKHFFKNSHVPKMNHIEHNVKFLYGSFEKMFMAMFLNMLPNLNKIGWGELKL